MKKYTFFIYSLLFLVLGITSGTPAQAQQQQNSQYALYNYRNDGEFNAWLNIDIDSITYSRFDLDGIEHDEIVVQEVWTPDSLYRIPMEAIDSIGFRAPKPEFASDIFYIRDYHANYTTSVNGLTIKMRNAIHKDSIPRVGQVILSATELTPYEGGFAGKVVDVQESSSGLSIICEEISIADIYKRLVLVGKVSNDTETYTFNTRRKGKASGPWINIDDNGVVPFELEEKSFSIGDFVKITSPTPKLTCSYYVYISELYYEVFVKVDLHHPNLTYTFTVTADQLIKMAEFGEMFMSILSNEKDLDDYLNEYMNNQIDKFIKEEEKEQKELTKEWFKRSKISIPIPIPTTGVLNLNLEISPILKAKGKLDITSEFKTDAWQSMSMKWKGFTPLKLLAPYVNTDIPDVTFSAHQDPFKSAKLDLKAKGTLTLGFKTLLNVNLIHKKLLYAGLACDFALMEVGGTLDFTAIDTERPDMNLYERFKDSNIKISKYAKGYAEAGLTPFDFLQLKTPKLKIYKEEKVYNILPHFTEPTLPKYNNGTWQGKKALDLFSYPSKDIFIPCKIGMRIIDKDGNPIKEYQDSYRYLDEYDWRNKFVSMNVSDLPKGSNYKCYPTISFFGWKPFNAGPVHNITVPLPIVASPSELKLTVGNTGLIEYFGGWDNFAVVISGNDKVASIIHDNETGPRKIKILGKEVGVSELQIEDRRTGEKIKVPIEVIDKTEKFTLSTSSLSMTVGDRKTVEITAGSGEYGVTNLNGDKAKATLNGTTITIEALAAGDAKVVVTDVKTGQKETIEITVIQNLQLSATKLSLVEGSSGTVEITAGSGEYGVTNLNGDKAKATLNGTTITIEALSIGDAKVVVTDMKSGLKVTIEISVTQKTVYPELTLSKQEVHLNVGETGQIEITSGTGSYSIVKYDTNVAKVTINGSTITINALSIGDTPVTITDKGSGKTATFGIAVKKPSIYDKDAVDLGLSVKWAKMNVGAVSEEDYGEHYAWGETESKSYFSWSSYAYCNGTPSTITKYNSHDGKTILDPADDAANIVMGGDWYTPTKAEMDELKDRCQWKLETLNGEKVYRVTGPNGKSIVLPLGGNKTEDTWNNLGSMGCYSVSTLSSEKTALGLSCHGETREYKDYQRYIGLSIRAVLRK